MIPTLGPNFGPFIGQVFFAQIRLQKNEKRFFAILNFCQFFGYSSKGGWAVQNCPKLLLVE